MAREDIQTLILAGLIIDIAFSWIVRYLLSMGHADLGVPRKSNEGKFWILPQYMYSLLSHSLLLQPA